MKVGLASSDMFDWNDQEISNIIWAGDEERGDHIVPYPEGGEEDGHKNLRDQQSSAIKLAENKLWGVKLDSHGVRPESSSAYCRDVGISPSGMDSWPNMASSKAAITGHASPDDEVFGDSSLMNKYLSKDICSQDEELTDFVEYGWENIANFDDLDRIFSNDEPMFATVALGNSDKIWSSSKYTANSPPKSCSIHADSPFIGSEILSKTSENMGVKSKFRQQSGQSSDVCFEKMENSVSLTLPLENAISDLTEGGRDDSNSFAVEPKDHSTSFNVVDENIVARNEFADKGRSWPSVQTRSCSINVISAVNYKHELSPSLSSGFPSSFNQQSPKEVPKTIVHDHLSNSYIIPPFSNYANPTNAVAESSDYESAEFNCQSVHQGYGIDSSEIEFTGKPFGSPGKPPLMVPKEKIERLRRRRRRQTQAMLAIQRHLQQFGNRVSHDFIAQKNALESLNQLTPGSKNEFDNLGALPSIDVSSSNEQVESSTLSAAVNGCSMEETMLHRLHEVVSKLDMAIRISVRDSLFRLAKSAAQRQQSTDINTSANRKEHPEVVIEEEDDASEREVEATDVETDTNPTDRAVAHLLFHRPVEDSTEHHETPESSTSAKLNLDRHAQGRVNFQTVESGKSSETELTFCTQDLASPCKQHMDCMDTSENGPAYIILQGGATEVVASR